MSPNAVTAAGLVTGFLSALSFSFGTRESMFLGVVLLHAVFILDNTDGDLARLTGRHSEFGRWFDVVSDLLVDTALWTGLWTAARARGVESPELHAAYALACLGSALGFLLILRERETGASFHVADAGDDARKTNRFFVFLESLTHNGISIVPAYAMALLGRPGTFLAVASIFMNGLWIARVAANLDALGLRRPVVYLAKAAAWGLGLFLLWRTFLEFSWREAGALLRAGGLGLLAVFAVFPLVCVLHALGLRALLSPESRRRVGFGRLYGIYLCGDSLNKITPFADVGGEPLKVNLLRKKGVPLADSVQAVYLSRVLLVLSEAVLIAAGAVLASVFFPSRWVLIFAAAAIGVSGAFLGILLFSKKALVSFLSRLSGASGAEAPELPRIRRFFAERSGDVVRAFLWNAAAWIFLFLEILWAISILGAEIGWLDAFILHAVLRAVQTATFFIPANLGSQEGGLAYLSALVGLSSAHGVALSLVKRLRQWLFAAAALLFLPLLSRETEH